MLASLQRRPQLLLIMIGLAAMVLPAVAPAPSEARKVVLGAQKHAPNGKGFGASRPKTVYLGGVPSGLVEKVRWNKWGKRTAFGYGKGWQYKPQGGYYNRQVRVKFRASRISRCRPKGPKAYTRLATSFQVRPGGPFGEWFSFGGSGSLCR